MLRVPRCRIEKPISRDAARKFEKSHKVARSSYTGSMQKLHLIATAAFGLEAVVARELKALGYEQQTVEDGRVLFEADFAAIPRCNLWLRSADRVLVRLGEFEARDFGELFDQTRSLPWADWLPVDAKFPVRGRSARSQLHSVPHCQSITKKAIVECMKDRHHRELFEETGAEFPIDVSLQRDRAMLTLDTTGPGLHKRGYRTWIGAAPLKETLAAGLVQLSFFNRDKALIDPFCGTGTIPIEAALIARNRAPGLLRSFVSQSWPIISQDLWLEARREARQLMLPPLESPIVGTDVDESVLKHARRHAEQAGVADDIHFQRGNVSEMRSRAQYGCCICNPPYGERLDGKDGAVEDLYHDLARQLRGLETWSSYVITSLRNVESIFGRKADRKRKLYNGRIECTYYQFFGPRPPRRRAPDEDGRTSKHNDLTDGIRGSV